MEKIIEYITNMMPFMLCSVPVIVVVRLFRTKALVKRGYTTTVSHEAGIVLFAVFLVGLASQTIIPKIEFGDTLHFIVGNGTGGLNLIPFKVISETYTAVFKHGYINYFLINFVGNIVMFMPFGFFIPLLWRKIAFKKVVMIGALSSLFIEICQLPQARGTDIDDILINTVGCILGFAGFVILKRFAPCFVERCKVSTSTK